MKLEDQVCSLELAKRLKELGVKQMSLFYFVPNKFSRHGIIDDEQLGKFIIRSLPFVHDGEYYSSYMIAELGELLPANFQRTDNESNYSYSYHLTIAKTSNDPCGYCVEYYCNKDSDTYEWQQENDTLPNCLAKMLIHLIEQGHVKV